MVTLGSVWQFSLAGEDEELCGETHRSDPFSLGSVVTLCSLFLPLLARYIQIWAQAEIFVKVSQPQSLEVVFIRRPGGSYIIYIALM